MRSSVEEQGLAGEVLPPKMINLEFEMTFIVWCILASEDNNNKVWKRFLKLQATIFITVEEQREVQSLYLLVRILVFPSFYEL